MFRRLIAFLVAEVKREFFRLMEEEIAALTARAESPLPAAPELAPAPPPAD